MIFTNQHRRIILRFLFLLVPYSLLRIGFYFYHLDVYKRFQPNAIFESFFLGVRFDIAAICLLNIPLLLLSLVSSTNSKFISFERFLFVLVNTVGIIVSLNDYELFMFMGKRLSMDFFAIADDIWAQLPQITMNYWYFPLIALVFAISFYFFDFRYFQVKAGKTPFWRYTLSGVLTLGMAFTGIRGGIQNKSISVQSAFIQGQNELGHLVLNTPYHFMRTLKNKTLSKLTYFKSDDAAKEIILNERAFRDGIQGIQHANVVVIILESFSLEYMEKGFTPFLSELSHKSLFFGKHFANGRRSIEALPSILCGLPSLLDEPISKSGFQGNKFNCFPSILKDAGYSSAFFHGGSRGTMGFESYTLANGFQKYYSREDYPEKKDFDGTWGIFDGPYLKFSAKKIDEMKAPFLAGIFTLSSHQPYSVPKSLKGKFPKGTLEIHESIGYTDQSLKEFFDEIKNKEWFKNTVFIITADHSQKLETSKFQNMIGQYRGPLLIYFPEFNWDNQTNTKVTQHADIPRTVLDFVEVKGELPLTSVSMFTLEDGLALNNDSGSLFAVSEKQVLILDKFNQQKAMIYDWETGDLKDAHLSQLPLLKAYLQYYVNGLINNNLSL
jgi:phosphoglycerol transferase MdoB-like AlkP superfamily enzyme